MMTLSNRPPASGHTHPVALWRLALTLLACVLLLGGRAARADMSDSSFAPQLGVTSPAPDFKQALTFDGMYVLVTLKNSNPTPATVALLVYKAPFNGFNVGQIGVPPTAANGAAQVLFGCEQVTLCAGQTVTLKVKAPTCHDECTDGKWGSQMCCFQADTYVLGKNCNPVLLGFLRYCRTEAEECQEECQWFETDCLKHTQNCDTDLRQCYKSYNCGDWAGCLSWAKKCDQERVQCEQDCLQCECDCGQCEYDCRNCVQRSQCEQEKSDCELARQQCERDCSWNNSGSYGGDRGDRGDD